MLGLNTRREKMEAGENGLAPSQVARRRLPQRPRDPGILCPCRGRFRTSRPVHETLCANLAYACCRKAAPYGIIILIEPLNRYDAPGYFLTTTDQARSIMDEVAAANLRLMFDCYHVQLMEGDLSHRIEALLPRIAHVQFASAPDRGPPDQGEVNYAMSSICLAENLMRPTPHRRI